MKIHLSTNTHLNRKDIAEFLILSPDTDIDVKYIEAKLPITYVERFRNWYGDFNWIRSITPPGYDIRGFITTKQELLDGGITSHIGLYDNHDSDLTMDFYIGLGTKLDRRAKLNGFKSNLAWDLVHEACHGLAHRTGKPEILYLVHDAEARGELKALFLSLQEDYQQMVKNMEKQVTLLQQVVGLFKKLRNLI